MDGLLAAELIEAAPVLTAIKMTDISIKNDIVNFGIGEVVTTPNLGFSLKIVKVKTFDSDEGVNVSKLGIELANGKYGLIAKAFEHLTAIC